MKNKIIAWYLDEDVLLEGFVIGDEFYPNTDSCGFDSQTVDRDMIDKTIFFDLEKAISVCGNRPVIKGEFVLYDHQIVAVNPPTAETPSGNLVYRDQNNILHTIDLDSCARKDQNTYPHGSHKGIGERNICAGYFLLHTDDIKTKIVFKKSYVFPNISKHPNPPKLLCGNRNQRFIQLERHLYKAGYSTLDET